MEGKHKPQETWLLPQAATAALSACFAVRAAEPSFVCLLLMIKCVYRLCFLRSSSSTRVFHAASKGLNRASKSRGSLWDHKLNFVYICIFILFLGRGPQVFHLFQRVLGLPKKHGASDVHRSILSLLLKVFSAAGALRFHVPCLLPLQQGL